MVLHFINASFRFNERKKKPPQTLQLHTIILVNENHKSNTKGKKKIKRRKAISRLQEEGLEVETGEAFN